jgi:hypothetical protein
VRRGRFRRGSSNSDKISKVQYSAGLTDFSVRSIQIPGGEDVIVVPRINFF